MRPHAIIGTSRSTCSRESVRDKVLYNLVAFAVLLIGGVVSDRPAHAPGRTSRSSRTSAWRPSPIFGLMIAVFIGIGLVWKEVERRSIYSAAVASRSAAAEFIARQVLRPRC